MDHPLDGLFKLFQNPVFLSAALAWIVAQGWKVARAARKYGFSMKILGESGGMPSGHSATVTAMTISCALHYGLDSAIFAVALFLSLIVIYDAAGVRYQSGQEADILNKLRERDIKEGREPLMDKPLKVKRGHTTSEIAVGILLGLAAAVFVNFFI